MGTPARKSTHQRIIAHHLILTLNGHWPPHDPRGSYSREVRKPVLRPLGAAHFGRRPAHEQPARDRLHAFHRHVGHTHAHRGALLRALHRPQPGEGRPAPATLALHR